MKLTDSKKGVLDNLSGLVIGLVVIGITLTIAFLIMSEVAGNATVTADANASAAIDDTQNAMSDIPGWLSIIVVAVIGAVLLTLVTLYRRR